MQNRCKYLSCLSILSPIHFSILLLHLAITTSSKSLAPLSPVDNVFLNCGASGKSTALDGREWIGDIGSKFASSLELNNTSIATGPLHEASSIDQVPYKAARIFPSHCTYTFQLSPGQKFIRLYFYPASYPGFERSRAFFSVKAGPYTLLSNFNSSQTGDSLGLESFVKEFSINVEQNQQLNITFAPSASESEDVYAFINGIEITSMPTSLYHTTAYSDAILNGVKMLKLKSSVGSLGSPKPHPVLITKPVEPSSLSAKKSKLNETLFIASRAGAIVAVIVVSFLVFFAFRQWMKRKCQRNKGSSFPEELCRRFTLAEIRTVTNNFDKALIIGEGGFGRVYKGYINGGYTPVAVKRLKSKSLQGAHEFWTEIEMLSRLRHLHLVSLIGYCNDERQMILVYDYMAHGTVRDHLYKTDKPPLSWKKRLEICIGAARALEYLHAGAEQKIIHRDVKTTNILLDGNWVAKVSDFGLSRMGPTSESRSHVSTEVKGTFGYLDPEYYWTHHLTEKSDVYAFGVVLFEMLCARAVVDMDLEDEQQSLAQWAQQCVKNDTIGQIIDPNLTGKIAPECLRVFAWIADKCLRDGRNERPKMSDVVRSLEFAFELQESGDGAKEGIKISSGAQRVEADEEMMLCGGGNQVGSRPYEERGLVHSCRTFWQKSISHKALFRFFSDNGGLKWASPSPPTFHGLNSSCFKGSPAKYDALPTDQGNCTHLRTIAVDVSRVKEVSP